MSDIDTHFTIDYPVLNFCSSFGSLRSVARFLSTEARKHQAYTFFPDAGWFTQKDPQALTSWEQNMSANTREQEADPPGSSWYAYEYESGD